MNAYQPVLDPACGGRMFWFDKSDSRVLFGDVRDESWELCDGRRFDVRPDMLMDYRDLPFPDETFRMVVLDPPHLRDAGEASYMAQKYGCLDRETWQTDIKTMFGECFRVLKEHGVLIFKWNETQIPAPWPARHSTAPPRPSSSPSPPSPWRPTTCTNGTHPSSSHRSSTKADAADC